MSLQRKHSLTIRKYFLMIGYKSKIAVFPVLEIFFSIRFDLSNLYTFRRYRHLSEIHKRPSFVIKESEFTLLVHLSEYNEDELWSNLQSNARNHINRGLRYGIECIYNDDLDTFYPIYHRFIQLKGMSVLPKSVFIELKMHLKFSFAVKDENILAVHCYLLNIKNKSARLFCSASPRLENTEDVQLISIANKLLTYQDMIYFKKSGFLHFDFGGFAPQTNDQQLLGINRFKKLFGGQLHQYYSYYTIPYYLIHKLSNFKNKAKELIKL